MVVTCRHTHTAMGAAALLSAAGCHSTAAAPSLAKAVAGSSGGAAALLEMPRSDTRLAPPPLVTLSGASRALSFPAGTRIYSRSVQSFVYERPSEDSPRIGYLRAGEFAISDGAVVTTVGCPDGFRAVQPRGFMCVGVTATLDPNDPVVAALASRPPNEGRKLPYIYGTVRKPGPVYARLPTTEELAHSEPKIDQRMQRWLTAKGQVGAGYAQFVWLGHPGDPPDAAADWRERRTEGVPAFLLHGGTAPDVTKKPRDPDQLVIGHTRAKIGFSLTDTFLWQGRRYGLTPELEILPTDRLRPIQGSEFHGVEIGKGIEFPIALVREPGTRYVVYEHAGNHVAEGDLAPYREAVPLTGRQQFFHGVLHYETKDGPWLSDRDASRLDPVRHVPGWAAKGERWIDVNITKQTLVLYDGTRPVYATLISSGEAGLEDPKTTTATRRGIFRIHAKHVATTMSSDEVGETYELRDVPYVEYFDDDGHALHGAYWHDKFGIPKSHGCINLAPEDARRIFYWTDPVVPDGWHGAFDAVHGTIVFIHP